MNYHDQKCWLHRHVYIKLVSSSALTERTAIHHLILKHKQQDKWTIPFARHEPNPTLWFNNIRYLRTLRLNDQQINHKIVLKFQIRFVQR